MSEIFAGGSNTGRSNANARTSLAGRESSPGEFHPKALAEPYVNVSVHTAPIIQPGKAYRVANGQRA